MTLGDVMRWWSWRRVAIVALLTAGWCAFWGQVSVANVASGVLVSACATLFGNDQTGRRVRLFPLLRLLWVVAIDLAVSTAVVVREVVTPIDYTDEAIVGVAVEEAARRHLLLAYVAITLTPGTAVVAADRDGSVLYLHILHADRRDSVEEHVRLLLELAGRSFPVDAAPREEAPIR